MSRKKVKLSELYSFQYGQGNTIENIGGDYPIYGSNGPVGFTNKYNNEDAPVIGHIGAYAGIVNWASGKHFVTYNGVMCNIKDGIDSKFGYYTLLVSKLQKRLRGSSQPFISYDLLNDIDVLLPETVEEQEKIGKVLSSIDDKIELNNKINSELEAMAKELYEYWFVQFDFPDENGKPYKSSGGKMVWNEELKREIPEGWTCGIIGDLFSSQAGYAFKSSGWADEGHPVLTIKAINEDGSIDIKEASYIEQYDETLKKYTVHNGNMIFAMSGNTIGKVGIISSAIKNMLINQRVLIIKTETSSIAYAYFILRDEKIQNLIAQLGANSAQPNISEESLRSIKISIPSSGLLEKYNKMCHSYFEKIINNRIENQELSKLRDFLLPMLMNGQVTVK